MNRPDIEAIEKRWLSAMDSDQIYRIHMEDVPELLCYVRELEFILEGLRK